MLGKFEKNGSQFSVDTPITPRAWTNKLFNDNYMVELDEKMQGGSKSFINYAVREDIKKQRHFYIRDIESKTVFCPLYLPLRTQYDSYKVQYGLGFQRVISSFDGLEVTTTTFVPTEGIKEVWSVIIKNMSERDRELSLFSVFSFEDFNYMGSYCEFDKEHNTIYKHAFPTHAKFDDKKRLDSSLKYVFAYCDSEVNSYETNKYRFYGCDDDGEMPKQVIEGQLGNMSTQGMESIIAAFENKVTIPAGGEYCVSFVLGSAVNSEDIKAAVAFDIQKEFERVNALWEKRCSKFIFDTDNEYLNYLSNYWLKKQVTYLSRTNRFDVSSPVRNELQDTMGYALCEPAKAFEIMKRVLKRQYVSGYIKQWNIHDGSGDRGLSTLRHSDAPIWIIICLIETIKYIINDAKLFEEKVGFIDSDEEVSVKEHIRRAAYFMSSESELGEHGMCLMRDGDWTDPMNAPGRFGRGESVWNSMALVYAINEYNKLFFDEELQKRADRLKENINKFAWDGDWYLAALDDRGEKLGTAEDEEGQIFLNTQTWAIISGVAADERYEKVKNSLERLKTCCGYKLSDPPFTKWNEKWGKISIKQAGALENGSIYCHGTLFKALADYVCGDIDAAMETILSSLPTNEENPNERNMQMPLYVPNYYYGIENENFGRSSCVYNTGTAAWILAILNRIKRDSR